MYKRSVKGFTMRASCAHANFVKIKLEKNNVVEVNQKKKLNYLIYKESADILENSLGIHRRIKMQCGESSYKISSTKR